MTDCYWTEEIACFEVCGSLPDLPVGWIRFDTIPDGSGGRSALYAGEDHPQMAKPAFGNGLIVIATAHSIGVSPGSNGSHETYGVYVSDDDGFTYGDFVDKFAWQPGAGTILGGYDANYQYTGTDEHFGTRISFDGTNFYVVNTTNDDADNYDTKMVTSKSSDGVTWSVQKVAGDNHAVTGSDSYGGKVWYIGTNQPDAEQSPFPADKGVVGFSGDDGATWASTEYTSNLNQGAQPYSEYTDCSANADGLHIVASEDLAPPFQVSYYRPTSDTTWAAAAQLFDMESGDYYTSGWGCQNILASRVNSNYVYTSAVKNVTDDTIVVRASSDGGVSWGAEVTAVQLDTIGSSEQFVVAESRNMQDLVELDDGRLIVVYLYQDAAVEYVVAYAMSVDNGASFAPPVIVSTNEWIYDSVFRAGRIYACAKGNDVVITQTDRTEAGNAFIFRP